MAVQILLAFTLLTAQTSRGEVIPSDRRIAWSPGVVGGIPIVNTIYTNLTTDHTLGQINIAIANCPSNQVVRFAPGTYVFGNSIVVSGKNGVVLRGAGPGEIEERHSADVSFSAEKRLSNEVRLVNDLPITWNVIWKFSPCPITVFQSPFAVLCQAVESSFARLLTVAFGTSSVKLI